MNIFKRFSMNGFHLMILIHSAACCYRLSQFDPQTTPIERNINFPIEKNLLDYTTIESVHVNIDVDLTRGCEYIIMYNL